MKGDDQNLNRLSKRIPSLRRMRRMDRSLIREITALASLPPYLRDKVVSGTHFVTMVPSVGDLG
jgi:predicted SPOUT superfamily RNA methylase MTH1